MEGKWRKEKTLEGGSGKIFITLADSYGHPNTVKEAV